MKPLQLEHVLQIHALVIITTGGAGGLRDLGRLEAALATQAQHVFGEELYGSTIVKAAALIRGIIADHPFIDGNKRTAMLTGLACLRLNAIPFKAHPGEIEDFAVTVATKRLGVPAIAKWLSAHTG